jgi:hypothetical protein
MGIKVSGLERTIKGLDRQLRNEVGAKLDISLEKMRILLADATPVDTGRARDGWRVDGKNLVNDVEYISALNEGHSPQAPSHYIEITLLHVEGVTPNGIIVQETGNKS